MNKLKLSIYDIEYHVNHNKKRVGCKITYRLNGDPKFMRVLGEFMVVTKDPIEWELTAYANLDPQDNFNVETGMKVARAKAESQAYNRVRGLLARYVDFNYLNTIQIGRFVTKANATVEHNDEYLSKF